MSISIDAHQHFWSLARSDYGWLTPALEPLYRDFEPSDLAPLIRRNGIDKTILVQAAPTIDETRYLLNIADLHEFIAGVVGWIDMEGGKNSVRNLRDLMQSGKFIGVRPMIQEIVDPAWMLKPALATVFEALVEMELRFDALIKPIHLPYLIELLHRYPALNAVVDHGAKPNIAENAWLPWATDIARVANETSAYCKISGLITETANEQSYQDVRKYMTHLFECFGPQRLMWGSDWPVLNLRSDYSAWHAIFADWMTSLEKPSRLQIAGQTAAFFYGLNGGPE